MPIGRFVVDFVSEGARLIVEVDGYHHGALVEADRERTAVLEAAGYLVVRFWNHEVMRDTDGVVARIVATLDRRTET